MCLYAPKLLPASKWPSPGPTIRGWAPILIFMLCIFVLFVGMALPSHAKQDDLVHWDDLAPSVEPYEDPFLDMTLAQKSDLRDVLIYQQIVESGQDDPDARRLAEGARARLSVHGLDADVLLAQRLIVMERRREEATGVTSTFLDSQILIDGFVLPLAWEGERVIEFLLVPWVGACIHTPPPSPNQIVHVSYPEGLKLERRFEAVRLQGTLRHEPAEHALFLIDGSRQIRVSYGLAGATLAGQPGEIVAASASDVPALARAQIWVNNLFTSGMTEISREGSIKAILLAVLMAFGYGALHTLGPGHGKAVVISYFIGTGGSLRRGLTMGTRIAVFHVISAIVLVFLLDLAVRQATGAAPADYRLIRLFSYALIVAIGTVMLWQAVRAIWRTSPESTHSHGRDQTGHEHASCSACRAQTTVRGGWIAAAVGVVPCTGALIVMLFGLANDLIWPAILMVIAISAGMAVAMAGIGIAALWGREWAEQRFASGGHSRLPFATGARLAGASCVFALGIGLFVSTFIHDPSQRNAIDEASPVSGNSLASGG